MTIRAVFPALLALTACATDASDEPELLTGHIETPYGPLDITYERIGDRNVYQGDIDIPDGDLLDHHDRSATALRSKVWPGGLVPYVIDASFTDPRVVNLAINHWAQRTALHFIPRTTEPDYVRFVAVTGVSSSAVGRSGGQQIIYLDPVNGTPGQAFHEIGHAAGLYHEQCRHDRDSFITVHPENIQSGHSQNFDKYPSGFDVNAYDLRSLMHYSSYDFSNGLGPSFTLKDGTLMTAEQYELSPGDLLGVEWLYGPPMQVGRSGVLGADGRLEIFELGTDHVVYHAKQTAPSSNAFGGWASLGGPFRATPTATRARDGHLEVYTVGFDNQLYRRTQNANLTWNAWEGLGGSLSGIPVIGHDLDGRLEIFARGTDNALWRLPQSTVALVGGFGGWQSFGTACSGSLIANPAVGNLLDGSLDVFVTCSDHHLWHRRETTANGPAWSTWYSLGGTFASAPAVSRELDGSLEVFAATTAGLLQHAKHDDSSDTWSAWTSLGATILGNPVVGRNADGRLELFGVGTDTSLGHMWQYAPNGSWSYWASYGGTTSSRLPDVVLDQDGRMEALASGVQDMQLYRIPQAARSSSWNPWVAIGGLQIVAE